MNTPPRKLLKVVKKISGKSPGITRTTATVPLRSTLFPLPSVRCTISRSSMGMSASMAMATSVAAMAIPSTHCIPSSARATPLATEVIPKAMPTTVPNIPFARSRRSSGTVRPMSVGMAML